MENSKNLIERYRVPVSFNDLMFRMIKSHTEEELRRLEKGLRVLAAPGTFRGSFNDPGRAMVSHRLMFYPSSHKVFLFSELTGENVTRGLNGGNGGGWIVKPGAGTVRVRSISVVPPGVVQIIVGTEVIHVTGELRQFPGILTNTR